MDNADTDRPPFAARRRAATGRGFRRACLGLALVPLLAAAAEHGELPYEAVAKLFDRFAALPAHDKLALSVRIEPAKDRRLEGALALEIRAAGTNIPVKLGPGGSLVDFPLTPALRAENPRIASNQPKGSLALVTSLSIRWSGRTNESALWYAQALHQLNAAAKSQAGLAALAVPTLRTVVFRFEPDPPASVSMQTPRGSQAVAADKAGTVRLDFGGNPDLKEARLVFPRSPRAIEAE